MDELDDLLRDMWPSSDPRDQYRYAQKKAAILKRYIPRQEVLKVLSQYDAVDVMDVFPRAGARNLLRQEIKQKLHLEERED